MNLSITLLIIIATCVISISAFTRPQLKYKLIFYPPDITNRNQWYRLFSCGLIHADYQHLIFNMLSLYFFGEEVEGYCSYIFGSTGWLVYILLYVTALAASLLPTYFKHKDDYHYSSLGASGAVSAVIFASILLDPWNRIYGIPGFIFGPLYLFISAYIAKQARDNINHSAHIWGSIYGVAFLLVLSFVLTDYNLLTNFVEQVKNFGSSR